MQMEELLHQVIDNQVLVSALSTVLIGVCSYLIVLMNGFKEKARLTEIEALEQQKSIKRSALRGEYLSIYNSDQFTQDEKYKLTRDIIREYTALNGNHYIHELEDRLKRSLLE